MKPKTYEILCRAVEQGVPYGLHRYYKHRDDLPDELTLDVMADEIIKAVMDEICVWFDFDFGDDEVST